MNLFGSEVFALFVWYDNWVYSRQNKLLTTTNKTHAVVSSLFPKDVHKRLLGDVEDSKDAKNSAAPKRSRGANMQAFLVDGPNEVQGKLQGRGPPIADLFPEATIVLKAVVSAPSAANSASKTRAAWTSLLSFLS